MLPRAAHPQSLTECRFLCDAIHHLLSQRRLLPSPEPSPFTLYTSLSIYRHLRLPQEFPGLTSFHWMGSLGKGLSHFSSLQLLRRVRPHGLQHARPPCPSPTPGVYSNSCPLSWWCHPTISSSVIHSLPAINLSQHQGDLSASFPIW